MHAREFSLTLAVLGRRYGDFLKIQKTVIHDDCHIPFNYGLVSQDAKGCFASKGRRA